MKEGILLLAAIIASVLAAASGPDTEIVQQSLIKEIAPRHLTTGWAIGNDKSRTAVIFHTRDGGRTWREQGDNIQWVIPGTQYLIQEEMGS